MLNITKEIQKLIKYTVNKTAVFTLASMMVLPITGCNSNSDENNILDSGYVSVIDGEIKLLQRVDVDSSVLHDDFEHCHYVDLITSSNYTDSKLCKNESYLDKDITVLGTLVNYLTEEEIVLSKNNGGGLGIVHLSEIYTRLRDSYGLNDRVEIVSQETYGKTPISDIADGVDAGNIFISTEFNGKDEVVGNHIMIYIDDYSNGVPGLFDLFDTEFQAFPCYKNEDVLTEEEKKTKLSNRKGQLFSYPILINNFLEENGLSYFSKDKFSFTELERIEALLNNKEVTKYDSKDVLVFVSQYSDIYNNSDISLDEYYVLIPDRSDYEGIKKFKTTHVLGTGIIVEYSAGSVFNYNDKFGTFTFDCDVNDKNIISINDLLSSVGLEDYTKREYSMGELIDINKYINSKNKGLKK